MKLVPHPKFGNIWLIGALAAWSLLFLACATVDRAIVAPLQIPGAEYVGTGECATCHSELVDGFKNATHSGLTLKADKMIDISCESCHGPGSKHVQAGGGKGTMLNPAKQTATCYQCHAEKRGEFNLRNSHPVASGRMTCSDCHQPHKDKAVAAGGTQLRRQNDACLECHPAQRGPFVYEHDALGEGCTVCHSPHGSVNARMLKTRGSNLCLQCHFEQLVAGRLYINEGDHASRMPRGTCWVAGCHEAVHGSQNNNALRY